MRHLQIETLRYMNKAWKTTHMLFPPSHRMCTEDHLSFWAPKICSPPLVACRQKKQTSWGPRECGEKISYKGAERRCLVEVFCTPVKTKPPVPCTDFRKSRWNHALHHQRAASNPSVLWAATGSQPAAIVQVLKKVQRLDLLSMQIKPASLHLHLHHTKTKKLPGMHQYLKMAFK